MGVNVKGVDEALIALSRVRKRFRAEFYYTQYNIIEILGKLSRLNYDEDTVMRGLKIINDEFILTEPTIDGYIKALSLKRRGFNDLIDLLLYATAVTRDLKLLTRDKDLIQFLMREGEPINNVLSEEDFLSNA
ncbi:PIN domain-containing protein [Vulcanisaeta sp. JCM 16159]|uniref:PIN domain-containing protein n=1 Tax=Vulcanisaeta sp. JCM 16159 TaxID=1295371 RepID=UPI001FB321F5|nr:PIN domain-containing protein [Vulcanisaeta sp. JCM 16159]